VALNYSPASSARLIRVWFASSRLQENDCPVKRQRISGPSPVGASRVLNLPGGSKSLLSACARLGSFFLAVPHRRRSLERLEQPIRARGNFIDRSVERGFVRARWLVESGDLSHELERCIANFIGCDGRVEVEQVLYIAAHIAILMLTAVACRRYFGPQNGLRIGRSTHGCRRAGQFVMPLKAQKKQSAQSQFVTTFPARFPIHWSGLRKRKIRCS